MTRAPLPRRIQARPATPLELAKFGHIAAALRQALDARGWKPGDLNEQLRIKRDNTGIYRYLNAKAAPAPKLRRRLSLLLGLPQAQLEVSGSGGEPAEGRALVVAETRSVIFPGPAARPVPVRPVFSLVGLGDGRGRLVVEIEGPIAPVMTLWRKLEEDVEQLVARMADGAG